MPNCRLKLLVPVFFGLLQFQVFCLFAGQGFVRAQSKE